MLQVTPEGITIPGEVIITWGELARVSMVTTNPAAGDDVFFALVTQGGRRAMVPHNSPMSSELLSRLQRLEGFDNGRFLDSMTSSDDAEFVVWAAVSGGEPERTPIPPPGSSPPAPGGPG